MEPFLQNWVLSVCVIAFTLCVGGGLMILFERWTPTNPHTAKFLVTGVVASAVAAVMPDGGNLFGGEGVPPTEKQPILGSESGTGSSPVGGPIERQEPEGQVDAGSSLEGEGQNGPILPPEEPGETNGFAGGGGQDLAADYNAVESTQSNASCILAPPSSIAERAAALGPRPDLNCATNAQYPNCVAELRSRGPNETVKFEARDCSRTIEAWRKEFVTPVELARVPYQAALGTAESRSRNASLESDVEWRDYVIAEINRLNGPSWQSYNDIDKRSDDDMEVCWHRLCRAD